MTKNTCTLDDIQEVFEAWVDATKSPSGRGRPKVLDEPRKRVIKKAFEIGFDKETLIDAVRGWQHSSFHNGDDGRVYNDIGLLLRNAKYIEQFSEWEQGINRPKEKNGKVAARILQLDQYRQEREQRRIER